MRHSRKKEFWEYAIDLDAKIKKPKKLPGSKKNVWVKPPDGRLRAERIKNGTIVPRPPKPPKPLRVPREPPQPKREVSPERKAWNQMKYSHRRVTAGWRRKVIENHPDINSVMFMCAICEKPLKFSQVKVDHCHNSMIVRGHLCHNCNLGLGYFKDSIHFLLRSAEYLGEHEKKIKELRDGNH